MPLDCREDALVEMKAAQELLAMIKDTGDCFGVDLLGRSIDEYMKLETIEDVAEGKEHILAMSVDHTPLIYLRKGGDKMTVEVNINYSDEDGAGFCIYHDIGAHELSIYADCVQAVAAYIVKELL